MTSPATGARLPCDSTETKPAHLASQESLHERSTATSSPYTATPPSTDRRKSESSRATCEELPPPVATPPGYCEIAWGPGSLGDFYPHGRSAVLHSPNQQMLPRKSTGRSDRGNNGGMSRR